MEDVVQLPALEAVQLGAADPLFYCKTFHARTARQEFPPFEREIWKYLEDPRVRLFEMMMFRGAAKTSRLRMFAARRIAYGMSKTILYIGASERDAIRSVTWLRNQVDRNLKWSESFGLKPGKKWEETQIEIASPFGGSIWVLGAGISGSLRGINFDDFRPDLIIVDDPQTDETAATEEQRNKIEDLILGAVKNSLAPEIDEPNAKLVMAITPQNKEDVAMKAMRDPQWHSMVVPCWTNETLYNDVDSQVSVWPSRLPTESLRADKKGAMRRNKLSVFSREMECRLVSPESAKFKTSWLNFYDEKPRGAFCVLSIDPVPPPSERQLIKGLADKDFEAICVWGRYAGKYYLMDYALNRGHTPSWTLAKTFELYHRYKCARLVYEAVAYQRSIGWMLQQEMARRRIYFPVIPLNSSMSKFARIENTLGGLAPQGLLHVSPTQSEFISAFEGYPNIEYFDLLDASAMGLEDISSPYLERDPTGQFADDDVDDFPALAGACP